MNTDRTKIDKKLSISLLFRILRWTVVIGFRLISFIVIAIFFAWIRQTPRRSYLANRPIQSNSDDIWDSHPKHYYDNEPPKPFSD